MRADARQHRGPAAQDARTRVAVHQAARGEEHQAPEEQPAADRGQAAAVRRGPVDLLRAVSRRDECPAAVLAVEEPLQVSEDAAADLRREPRLVAAELVRDAESLVPAEVEPRLVDSQRAVDRQDGPQAVRVARAADQVVAVHPELGGGRLAARRYLLRGPLLRGAVQRREDEQPVLVVLHQRVLRQAVWPRSREELPEPRVPKPEAAARRQPREP